MQKDRFLKAVVLGMALAIGQAPAVQSETLRVMNGAPSSALHVAMNQAVVVETEEPFAEVSIANPSIADISTLSDRTLYILGKAPGRTTLTLLGPDGGLITNVDVRVAPDIVEFKERLRQILPNEQIEVRTANDGIVLSGTVSSIQKLDRALDLAGRYAPGRVSNLMSVGGNHQVLLKVRFAEMQRSVSKGLQGGFTLNGTAGNNAQIGAGAGNGGLVLGAEGENGLSPIVAAHNLSATAIGGALAGIALGGLQFNLLMEALENKGVVRTLAEPNLVALSGQEAKFLAGGEYPIPVESGDNGVAVDYKPFGVELNFTPRVVDGDVINLELTAAVSGIDPTVAVQSAGFSFDAFRRREASTTVEMRDGESFAIAGLLEDDFRDLIGQVPWLGDIPVLGALFRSSDYERRQSELVIIITPHLVTPTRGEALALPTDRIRPPTEGEFFLFGKTAAASRDLPSAVEEVAKQDFSGSYGYVME